MRPCHFNCWDGYLFIMKTHIPYIWFIMNHYFIAHHQKNFITLCDRIEKVIAWDVPYTVVLNRMIEYYVKQYTTKNWMFLPLNVHHQNPCGCSDQSCSCVDCNWLRIMTCWCTCVVPWGNSASGFNCLLMHGSSLLHLSHEYISIRTWNGWVILWRLTTTLMSVQGGLSNWMVCVEFYLNPWDLKIVES